MRKVALAVLAVGIYSRVDAAVLCTPKSGQGNVAVRTECKKNETQLDPVALGLRVQGPAVYDANEIKVGSVIRGSPGQANTLFEVSNFLVVLQITKEKIEGSSSTASVLFQSSDCSGSSFVEATNNLTDIFPYVLVRNASGRTLYLKDESVAPQQISIGSHFIAGEGICRIDSGNPTMALPAIPLIDLDTLFTPPFRVEVQE